jgi:CelD/BcsL family acetyltransferase involved in cellulose biosynthesis
VEAFLDLEHRGWKGETRTSLRSNPADEAFFREAVAGFAGEERAVFTELLLDGEVIASTSNFVSGRAGFAFKIGWRPDLAKVSPGVLNEMELLTHMYGEPSLGDLDFWDSGAAEGSYIDKLWPGRRALVSMAIATTRLGRSVMSLVRAARALRKRHRARQPAPSAATAPPEDRG